MDRLSVASSAASRSLHGHPFLFGVAPAAGWAFSDTVGSSSRWVFLTVANHKGQRSAITGCARRANTRAPTPLRRFPPRDYGRSM